MQNLDEPIKGVGIPEVAKACGVSERAVYKWLKNGFLPKTEFWENEIRIKNRRDFWWQISSKRNA